VTPPYLHLSRHSTLLFYRFFFFTAPPPTALYTLSLHDALPICRHLDRGVPAADPGMRARFESVATAFTPSWKLDANAASRRSRRSEEHTSELQSRGHLVCRLLLEKKKSYARISNIGIES